MVWGLWTITQSPNETIGEIPDSETIEGWECLILILATIGSGDYSREEEGDRVWWEEGESDNID